MHEHIDPFRQQKAAGPTWSGCWPRCGERGERPKSQSRDLKASNLRQDCPRDGKGCYLKKAEVQYCLVGWRTEFDRTSDSFGYSYWNTSAQFYLMESTFQIIFTPVLHSSSWLTVEVWLSYTAANKSRFCK